MKYQKLKISVITLAIVFFLYSYYEMFDYLKNNQYDLVKMFTDQASTNYGRFFLSDLTVTVIGYIILVIIDPKIKRIEQIGLIGLIFLIGIGFSICIYIVQKINYYQKQSK